MADFRSFGKEPAQREPYAARSPHLPSAPPPSNTIRISESDSATYPTTRSLACSTTTTTCSPPTAAKPPSAPPSSARASRPTPSLGVLQYPPYRVTMCASRNSPRHTTRCTSSALQSAFRSAAYGSASKCHRNRPGTADDDHADGKMTAAFCSNRNKTLWSAPS